MNALMEKWIISKGWLLEIGWSLTVLRLYHRGLKQEFLMGSHHLEVTDEDNILLITTVSDQCVTVWQQRKKGKCNFITREAMHLQ